MPNSNAWTSAARELRRLTRRMNAAVARTIRERRRGVASGTVRGTAVGARAAAGRGMPSQPGVRIGPVGQLLTRIVNHYPRRGSLVITSAYRPGRQSHHGGLSYKGSPTAAIDVASGSAAEMRDIAKWLYDRFAGDTVELIHSTPFASDRGFYVKHQRKYPGGGPYPPVTRRQHRNHVHFATSKALAAKILARLEAKGPRAGLGAARLAAAGVRAAPGATRGPRRLSKRGAQFIADHEGLELRLYNDPAGHCTIGVGHLVHRGRCNGSEPAAFKRGITKQQAYALLQRDAARMERAVNALGVPLNQNQFDALVSFTYNLGPAWTVQKTGIRDAVKARRYRDVPREMKRWVKAGGKVLPGLVRRRNDEARLFATPAGPSPSPPPKTIAVQDVQPGQSNPSVLVVQKALAKTVGLDYSSGPGNFGPYTRKAYAAWQRKCGIPAAAANGKPELASLKKLGAKAGFTVRAPAAPPPRSSGVFETGHGLTH